MKLFIAAVLALHALSGQAEEVLSSSKRYRVVFDRPNAGWPLNAQYSLPVQLFNASGSDLPPDLKVEIEATMPAHRHGTALTPSIRRAGSNSYRIVGLLMHMPGAWEIRLTFTASNYVDEAIIHANVD